MKIKNDELTPVGDIVEQMLKPRPLPMGRTEFDDWAARIISGALVPHEEAREEDFIKSQRFVLASMVLHLGPTESHKPDAFFIHSLRKVAINQVCHAIAQEIKNEFDAKAALQAAGPTLVKEPEKVKASDIS